MLTISTISAASTHNQLWAIISAPVGAVLGVIATMAFARVNDATNRRRERYAEAVQTLVAWTEFPYRVRRRVDNTHATLTALANRGHDLQERLAYHQAWIATEHPDLAHTYATARATINRDVGPCISDAWEHDPVTAPSGMNLRGWGPGKASSEAIANLQNEIANRFGFRRINPESITSSRGRSGKDTQPIGTHVDLPDKKQRRSHSKSDQESNDSWVLKDWKPLRNLHWVFFLLLGGSSYSVSCLYNTGFLVAWLLPLTGLGLVLGFFALSPWWMRVSSALVDFVDTRVAWVASISGTATSSVFVGWAIFAAIANPGLLQNLEGTGIIGELFGAPVTVLITTIALGVYSLSATTVFYLCSSTGVKRITSSIVALSTVSLPILLALSAHYMLRITLLGFLD